MFVLGSETPGNPQGSRGLLPCTAFDRFRACASLSGESSAAVGSGLHFRRFSWRHATLLLILALVVANGPLLVGVDGPNWDASTYFGPAWTLIADEARAGRPLLWNPYIEGGSPDGVQPELGAFSPLVLATGLLFGGMESGFAAYAVLILLLAGLGFLRLARQLGAPPWAGFVVSCGYVFSGTFTGHFPHTSWLHAYAFLPWVLWRLDAALEERRWMPAAQAGGLLGLSGLAGYPGIVVQTGVLVVAWAVGRCFLDRRGGREAIARSAGLLVVTAVVSIVVVAPAWYGFRAESRGYTDRSEPLSRDVAVHQNALHPGAVATFASPYIHVLAAFWAPGRWPPTDPSSLGLYTGAAIPALAAFALARGRRRRWLASLAALAAFSLAASIDALPLRAALYDLVPWERWTRHGAQRKDFALFLLAVLAVYGARRLSEAGPGESDERADRNQFAASAAGVGLAAVLCGAGSGLWLGAAGPRPAFAVAHFMVAWGGLLATAWCARSEGGRFAAFLPILLVGLAVVDAAGAVRLSRVLMVDRGGSRRAWDRISREKAAGPGPATRGLSRDAESPEWTYPKPNNQNVPLRAPVLASYTAMTNAYRKGTSGEPLLARTAVGADRVWFATEAVETPPDDASWRDLVEGSRSAGAAILVVHPPATMVRPRARAGDGAGPARRDGPSWRRPLVRLDAIVRRYDPDDVELAVTAPAEGWLLFTDRWARGWRAWTNGREVPVWGGNLIFRAVRVPPGAVVVRFAYRPAGYPWLLVTSWGALLLVFVAGLGARSRAPFLTALRSMHHQTS